MQQTALPEEGTTGEIATLVPAFTGEGLGQNVGTVLNLEIWRTLRIPATLWPDQKSRIRAIVSWSTEPLPDSSYEYTEAFARRTDFQLVLWGSIVRYGDGILAQPLLTILPGKIADLDDTISWSVSNKDAGRLSVRIPRLRYELPPIILGNDLLELYPTPASVKIYRGEQNKPPSVRRLGPPIGELGRDYIALVNAGDFTRVKNERGQEGWIYLPKLAGDNEIVNFVGGLIRLLRRDYSGAVELLAKVSASDASVGLKVDSFHLQALATAKLNNDPGTFIYSAKKLNPYLQATEKFEMVYLASQIQSGSPTLREAAASVLAREISEQFRAKVRSCEVSIKIFTACFTSSLISLVRRSFQSGVLLASLGNSSATFTAN
jgi:hypothetical protein